MATESPTVFDVGASGPRGTFVFVFMYGVFVWRGTRQGWELCCTPRDSRSAAQSFYVWVSRVRGDRHTFKVLPIEA